MQFNERELHFSAIGTCDCTIDVRGRSDVRPRTSNCRRNRTSSVSAATTGRGRAVCECIIQINAFYMNVHVDARRRTSTYVDVRCRFVFP